MQGCMSKLSERHDVVRASLCFSCAVVGAVWCMSTGSWVAHFFVSGECVFGGQLSSSSSGAVMCGAGSYKHTHKTQFPKTNGAHARLKFKMNTQQQKKKKHTHIHTRTHVEQRSDTHTHMGGGVWGVVGCFVGDIDTETTKKYSYQLPMYIYV